ncbi:cbf5 (nucleomorph) [Hemiselmis andersenii]|uniref:Cbf5 n=1 Tax=Hemiselmis andersenii TaxID=464988 RepID=A9BKY1_HEMAN|nr:cbf5 [Hemiselmis andersenii]ABW98136.1 cbf5 [Hemiselmis andersenii]|mmetsp:Transcript_43055/g.99983  ORF Transcript_43055/g.99983 Transcript_43055/m.99983 type:complete len:383 (+) Transcript_43055:54-1202(+)
MKNKNDWPLLLRNFYMLDSCKKQNFSTNKKIFPSLNFLEKKNKNGLINFDKPFGCNSHEILHWIEKILKLKTIKCFGKAPSNISGCMILGIGKSFLNKLEFSSKSNYILVYTFPNLPYENFRKINAWKKFNFNLFKNYFVFSKIKQQLLLNRIFQASHLEFDIRKKIGVFEITVQFPISTQSLIINLGFLFRKKIKLLEIRRIRIGSLTEEESLATFHDLLDAQWLKKHFKKNFFFRKIILPLDVLFSEYRRVLVKDSSINSICFGAGLTSSGILKIEPNIEIGEKIVLLNFQGDPIAIGVSKINSYSLFNSFSGLVVETKKVFIQKGFYRKKWHFGPTSTKKNILLSIGIDKFFKKKKFNNQKWWKRVKVVEKNPKSEDFF